MAAPIGVGDWVECVKALPCEGQLVVGRLYCVSGIGEASTPCIDPSCHSTVYVDLVGLDDGEYGYCDCEVRPIYRPSSSLFLERLVDVPADPELQDA